jgi:hypothetical protein
MRDRSLPLRRRRQWALLPRGVQPLRDWHRVELSEGSGIAHDPDLPVVQSVTTTASVTLIGFAIDPDEPGATTSTIVQSLARHPEPARAAQRLAGRWVLHVDSGGRAVMLHDACGLRQLVWTATPGTISCASDPSLLAEVWGFERDAEAATRYIDSPEYRRQREAWWPGTSTPYREIQQLLPNHLLDLRRACPERYWPTDPIAGVSSDEAATGGAQLLQALVRAAANRFPLALPLTAGWDSRLLYAATETTGSGCWHYTLEHDGLNWGAQDLVVASELLRRRAHTQHVIHCPSRMSEAFAAVYGASVTSPHKLWGRMAEGLWEGYPSDRICMRGNVSEVARTYHRWHGDDRVTPADLAVCHAARGNAFVIEQLAAWQREAEPVAARAGIHLLDLFYWEQKMGRWQAEYQLELDLVQETYTPYNHRPLLELLLGTPERSRRGPGYELHRRMIERLDPSLLDVPVNPKPWRERARSRLDRLARNTARRTGAYRRLRGTNA